MKLALVLPLVWTGKSSNAMLGLFYGSLVIREPLRKLQNTYDLPNQNEE